MKAVFVSGNAPLREHSTRTSEAAPSQSLLGERLAALGIECAGGTLTRFPLNALARQGTFYAGFDPLRALRVLLRHRDLDVIVGVGESSLACILPLARHFRFAGPILLREISGPGWTKRDRVVDYVLPRVDGVLALTPHQAAWAADRWRLKSAPDMVGFGIDESFFRPQPAADGGYVLAVGDDAGRDYACLLEASRTANWRLVLRADRPPPIPADLRSRVKVVGRIPFAELRTLYAAATVVALPLLPVDYPSGITALFEGLAMGRPVVASRIGSTEHVVRHGENGLVVSPGDPAALRGALDLLMADRPFASRLGAAGRATIENGLSYDSYVERLATALWRHVDARRTGQNAGAWRPVRLRAGHASGPHTPAPRTGAVHGEPREHAVSGVPVAGSREAPGTMP